MSGRKVSRGQSQEVSNTEFAVAIFGASFIFAVILAIVAGDLVAVYYIVRNKNPPDKIASWAFLAWVLTWVTAIDYKHTMLPAHHPYPASEPLWRQKGVKTFIDAP